MGKDIEAATEGLSEARTDVDQLKNELEKLNEQLKVREVSVSYVIHHCNDSQIFRKHSQKLRRVFKKSVRRLPDSTMS